MLSPLWAATAELTRLPTPAGRGPFTPEERARAVPWYPLVGLVLGTVVAVVALVLADLPRFLSGALTTAVWIGLTGAVTLQGLAALAEAGAGGGFDRLRIAAPPANGPTAVSATVITVLAKTAAVGCLAGAPGSWTLVAAPVAGRSLQAALLAITPAASYAGSAGPFAGRFDRAAVLLGALGGIAAVALLMGAPGLLLALGLIAGAFALRALCKHFLGGISHPALRGTAEAGELITLAAGLWGVGCP